MSIIKNSSICKWCGNKLRYYWILPDFKCDVIPKDLVSAYHERKGNKYLVSVKCDCGRFHSFAFTLEGEFLGEWSG